MGISGTAKKSNRGRHPKNCQCPKHQAQAATAPAPATADQSQAATVADCSGASSPATEISAGAGDSAFPDAFEAVARELEANPDLAPVGSVGADGSAAAPGAAGVSEGASSAAADTAATLTAALTPERMAEWVHFIPNMAALLLSDESLKLKDAEESLIVGPVTVMAQRGLPDFLAQKIESGARPEYLMLAVGVIAYAVRVGWAIWQKQKQEADEIQRRKLAGHNAEQSGMVSRAAAPAPAPARTPAKSSQPDYLSANGTNRARMAFMAL